MRALLLCAAVSGLAAGADADAGGNLSGAQFAAQTSIGTNAPHFLRASPVRSGTDNGSRFGNINGFDRDPDRDRNQDMFHHFHRAPVVYVLPVYGQQASVDQEGAGFGYDQPDYVQTRYVQVPAMLPAAPAVAATPPRPAQVVQYATSGQQITIPAGAHVTKGSVYKYPRNGVNTYTNVPPPQSAGAKLLFGYTEAISTAAAHTMYRCNGSKTGNVGYSETPVPNQDCKAISYSESSAN